MPIRNLTKSVMLGAGILIVAAQLSVATSEAALSTPPYLPALSPTEADAGSPFLVAAEPFETLTEMAFSVPGLRLDSAIAAADAATKRAGGSLPQESAAQLDARLRKILDPSDPFGDIGHIDAWSTHTSNLLTQAASRV